MQGNFRSVFFLAACLLGTAYYILVALSWSVINVYNPLLPKLLELASNGYQTYFWIAVTAQDLLINLILMLPLAIIVSRFPPGRSNWNIGAAICGLRIAQVLSAADNWGQISAVLAGHMVVSGLQTTVLPLLLSFWALQRFLLRGLKST